MAYLPHDEAVAAGLGGLDVQESQTVVDLLNNALASLLRAKPRELPAHACVHVACRSVDLACLHHARGRGRLPLHAGEPATRTRQ
jgi:hypothetical protein